MKYCDDVVTESVGVAINEITCVVHYVACKVPYAEQSIQLCVVERCVRERVRIKVARVGFVLSFDFLDVRFRCAPNGALDVEHR